MSWTVIVLILKLIASSVVASRVICAMAHLDRTTWPGRPWQFGGMGMAYALILGGAVAVFVFPRGAALFLLLGVAGWVLFDRRSAR